jgi:glycerol-3-phosphate acyltransferase PlsX
MAAELKAEMEKQNVKLDIRQLYQRLDYSTYGGAPLLGVNGVVVIAHGGSPPQAIRNGIGVAARGVESRMVEHIAARLGELAETSEDR